MKLLLKTTLKLSGLIITICVLLTAFTLISERASSKFEQSGSYTSELLGWEQEHANEGRLIIFGHPFKVDMEAMRKLESGIESAAAKAVDILPDNTATALQSVWSSLQNAVRGLFELLF